MNNPEDLSDSSRADPPPEAMGMIDVTSTSHVRLSDRLCHHLAVIPHIPFRPAAGFHLRSLSHCSCQSFVSHVSRVCSQVSRLGLCVAIYSRLGTWACCTELYDLVDSVSLKFQRVSRQRCPGA